MSELTLFQDAFCEALVGDFAPLAPWTCDEAAELRFSVYRNTVAKGCADALAAQFPTVLRLVGEGWLREAGVLFAADHPPAQPCLTLYGEAFADWLAAFAPAADMPWLADVARIDWATTLATFAADDAVIAAAEVAVLPPEDLTRVSLQLHPAAQVLWFAQGAPSLWCALQGETAPVAAELTPEPEGLLLTRPDHQVLHHLLGRGAHAFLAACGRGASLAGAAEAALAAEPELLLAQAFAALITAGALARLIPLSET